MELMKEGRWLSNSWLNFY